MIARYDELNGGNENAAITEIENGSPRDGQQGRTIEDELTMLKADPLTALYERAEELGFGPQKDQFVGVILACVSAASGHPINIHLCGEYSAGKSMTIKAATEIVGPDYLAAKPKPLQHTVSYSLICSFLLYPYVPAIVHYSAGVTPHPEFNP